MTQQIALKNLRIEEFFPLKFVTKVCAKKNIKNLTHTINLESGRLRQKKKCRVCDNKSIAEKNAN